MITTFRIFEKLGRIESVENITDIVWEEYKKSSVDKDFVMYDLESKDFKIKKLTIKHYYDPEVKTFATFTYESHIDKKGNYYVVITMNTDHKKDKTTLHHELIHAYEFLKVGADMFWSHNKDLEYFARMSIPGETETDKFLDKFLDIMYYINLSEIIAYFNQDIKNFMEKRSRFKNVDAMIKNSFTYNRYENIKEFDIEEIRTFNKELVASFIEVYYEIRKDKLGPKNKLEEFKRWFLDKLSIDYGQKIKVTDNEIDNFIKKFKEEIEFKKRVYLKYIGRLRTILAED